MTADQLMLWARNKYDLLLDKGTWNAPTAEEEKIIALQTQVKEMAKKLQNKQGNNSKPKSTQASSSKTEKKTSKRKEKPSWFSEQPKDTSKTVKWNNRDWNWCGSATGGHCEAFVIHKPSECKGIKKRKGTTSTPKPKKPKLKVEQTITATNPEAPIQVDDDFIL